MYILYSAYVFIILNLIIYIIVNIGPCTVNVNATIT